MATPVAPSKRVAAFFLSTAGRFASAVQQRLAKTQDADALPRQILYGFSTTLAMSKNAPNQGGTT